MKRYATKLLFQFRVTTQGKDNKRRLCEERIFLINARSAQSALRKSKSKGAKAQYDYLNDEGNQVYFEFVGIMDIVCLDAVCEEDEVWYDIKQMLCPMERKKKILPHESDLCAIKNND